MPLNIDHWINIQWHHSNIDQLWDQLNLSISQGFRYKPRGAIANPEGACAPPPRLTPDIRVIDCSIRVF